MPTPLPSQRPITSTRTAPQAKSGNQNYVLIALLLLTAGVGGYGWVKHDERLKALEAKYAVPSGPAGTRPGAVSAGNAGGFNQAGNFNGQGGGGPGGGRGGGGRGGRLSAATIMQNFGIELNDAQVNQLDSLLQERTQLRNTASIDLGDPSLADTSAIDSQLAGMVGVDVFSQISQTLNAAGGRGGRGGRGGGGGGPGGGGFGGGGGGFGGGGGG